MTKELESLTDTENKPGTPLWKALLLEHRLPWRYRQLPAYKTAKLFLSRLLYPVRVFIIKLRKKKKMSVLYNYAHTQRYPSAFGNLLELLKGISGFKITIVRIDNLNETKETCKVKHKPYDIYDIGGDNRDWHFSGWKKGLNFLHENRIRADLIFFANDAFLNLSELGFDLNYYKSRINTVSVYGLKENEALGTTWHHEGNMPEIFLGHDVSWWMRANLFIISENIADKLDFTFIDDKLMEHICPKEISKEIFKDNNLLNANLKKCLTNWLTGRWYKQSKMTEEEWDSLRSKAKDYLNERMLLLKLKEEGVTIIDMFKQSPWGILK